MLKISNIDVSIGNIKILTNIDINIKITININSFDKRVLFVQNIGIRANIYTRPRPLIKGSWCSEVFSFAMHIPKKLFSFTFTNLIPMYIKNAEKKLINIKKILRFVNFFQICRPNWQTCQNLTAKVSRIFYRSKLNCGFAAKRCGRNLRETRRIYVECYFLAASSVTRAILGRSASMASKSLISG